MCITKRARRGCTSGGSYMRTRFVKVMLGVAPALVAALCLACIPASAGAADVAEVTTGGATTAYDTFDKAWTAAEAAGTAEVKLLANVDKDNHTAWPVTVASGKTITLDLNGFDINRGLTAATVDGNVITVQGSLTLRGAGKITGGYAATLVGIGGGVRVINGGNLTMYGGEITGNTAAHAAGVYVNNGSFVMNGGEIAHNVADTISGSTGGGLILDMLSDGEINGGAIYGNTADSAGGIDIKNGKMLTMSGGKIYGNKAKRDSGGVRVGFGNTFKITGGEISGNDANQVGGGVFISGSGSLEMSGGRISGNTALNGGGVYSEKQGTAYGSIKLSGQPVIIGNSNGFGAANNVYLEDGVAVNLVTALEAGAAIGVTARTPPSGTSSVDVSDSGLPAEASWTCFLSDNSSYGIYLDSNKVALKNIDASIAAIVSQGGYYKEHPTFAAAWNDATVRTSASTNPVTVTLFMDVTNSNNKPASWPIDVPAGKHIVLNTGSYEINREQISATTNGSVITVSGSLTLTGKGIISGGKTRSGIDEGGGGVRVGNGGEFTMHGGEITGNSSGYGGGVRADGSGKFKMLGGRIYDNQGSGVALLDSAVFDMNDGEIYDNAANYGGGIYIPISGTFNMTGGKVYNNTSTYHGGGVYINNDGTFDMRGGEIAGNTADTTGGGVWIYINGVSSISGGSITGNKAPSGGGVILYNGTLNLSFKPVISGNTKTSGAADNLFLMPNKTVTITAALEAGADIGITTASLPVSGRPINITGANNANYRQYFKSDNAACAVVNSGAGSAQVVRLVRLPLAIGINYFDKNGETYTGKSDPLIPQTHNVGIDTTLVDGKKDGFAFGGWFTTSDCQTGTDVTTLGAYDYATDITLYAKWEPYVISFTTQPAAATTVTVGSITEKLTAAASVTPSGTAALDWYACNSAGAIVGGSLGTGGSFDIPTGLAVGTYYYLCQATLAGIAPVNSSVAMVKAESAHPDPDPSENLVTGIAAGQVYTQGDNVTFTIKGGGSGNTNPKRGDKKYRGLSWKVNPSGDFKTGDTQSFSTAKMNPGAHTLSVVFVKQEYDGAQWVDISPVITDTKTVSFTLRTRSAPPKTGDDGKPLVWLALGVLSVAGAAVALRRRRFTDR